MARQNQRSNDEGAGEEDTAVTADPRANRERLMQRENTVGDKQAPKPRFSEEGAPIDEGGLPRELDPGEIPPDDVERSPYVVGKGGLAARRKVYTEGETILLSEEEANQILDMGNQVTHADPVEAKSVSERRAERDGRRREKHAERHQAAVEETQADVRGE